LRLSGVNTADTTQTKNRSSERGSPLLPKSPAFSYFPFELPGAGWSTLHLVLPPMWLPHFSRFSTFC